MPTAPLATPTGEERPPRGGRKVLPTLALASGLFLGGFGIAYAQNEQPGTTAPPAAEEGGATDGRQQPEDQPKDRPQRPGKEPGSRPGKEPGARPAPRYDKGRGLAGAIHGEFVVKAGESGYRTMVTQRGVVEEVSRTSLRVKSEDGFVLTYVVSEQTLVNAGRDGIEDVQAGHEVHVRGVRQGQAVAAMDIVDLTRNREIREHWRPEGGQEPAEPQAA